MESKNSRIASAASWFALGLGIQFPAFGFLYARAAEAHERRLAYDAAGAISALLVLPSGPQLAEVSRIVIEETREEALIHEVHHRAKDNLQLISSLLSLQMEQLEREGDSLLYQESIQRVMAIASIHEMLYDSGVFVLVALSSYIKNLVSNLEEAYGREFLYVSMQSGKPARSWCSAGRTRARAEYLSSSRTTGEACRPLPGRSLARASA